MEKVRQTIKLAIKLGRIKIIIDKSWSLPFSLWSYNLKKFHFGVNYYWQVLEISLFKINIIIAWGKIEE